MKKITAKIEGMHCGSCEVLIERSFKKIRGIEKAKVSHAMGEAELWCSKEPNEKELNDAIREHGYSVSELRAESDNALDDKNKQKRSNAYKFELKKEHLHTGAIFLVLLG